jgi:hypothetical protein
LLLFIFSVYILFKTFWFPQSTFFLVAKNKQTLKNDTNSSTSDGNTKKTETQTTTESKGTRVQKLSESEFVSDTFQTSEKDLEEIKAGMRKLGIDSLAQQAIETNNDKNGKTIISIEC